MYDNPRVCLCVDVNVSVHVLEWSDTKHVKDGGK